MTGSLPKFEFPAGEQICIVLGWFLEEVGSCKLGKIKTDLYCYMIQSKELPLMA